MGIFNWFTGDNQQSEEQVQRQDESRRRLKAGGLPLPAVERLQEQRSRQNTPGHLWTSDLSVPELALVNEQKFVPLGQVMGSSVYHVGFQWRTQTWRNSYRQGQGAAYEMDVLTQAFYNARHLALGRLRQEAELLGATGVVGVRLERKEYEWGAEMLEFAAIGTAIREENLVVKADARPQVFLSELSGQEFWQLRKAGFRPCGVAVGNCTYYQIPSWNTRNVVQGGIFNSQSWQNVELPDYTQSLYTARSLAMSRMEAEARSVGGTGIVSVDVQLQAEPAHMDSGGGTRIDMMYHFTAIGTAIQPFAYQKPKLSIGTTVSLRPLGERRNEDIKLDHDF
jgi:uncharacterized protein YbjQ (UPF0145 family)